MVFQPSQFYTTHPLNADRLTEKATAAEYNHEHVKEIVLNVKAMTHLAQFSLAFAKGKGHLYTELLEKIILYLATLTNSSTYYIFIVPVLVPVPRNIIL